MGSAVNLGEGHLLPLVFAFDLQRGVLGETLEARVDDLWNRGRTLGALRS